MPRWSFFDFQDAAGSNLIETWLNSKEVPLSDREDVRRTLRARLEAHQNTDLEPPQFKPLHGVLAGLVEIKLKVGGTLYRPIVWIGPGRGEVTILVGAKERNGRFVPKEAVINGRAWERQALIIRDRRYITPHVYTKRESNS